MRTTKVFPSKVNWLKLWKRRWLILNLLNQIAHGTERNAIYIVEFYGGEALWAKRVYAACREIISVKGNT